MTGGKKEREEEGRRERKREREGGREGGRERIGISLTRAIATGR